MSRSASCAASRATKFSSHSAGMFSLSVRRAPGRANTTVDGEGDDSMRFEASVSAKSPVPAPHASGPVSWVVKERTVECLHGRARGRDPHRRIVVRAPSRRCRRARLASASLASVARSTISRPIEPWLSSFETHVDAIARMEAASVDAFRELERDLVEAHAPNALLERARRATRQ